MGQIKIIRWISGFAAASLFAAMAFLFQTQIPTDLLLPQQSFTPYAESALPQFAEALGEDLGLYRFLLLWVDTGFISAFSLWVFSNFYGRMPVAFGVVFSAAPALADMTENVMIAARMGIATKGNFAPEVLLADPSPTYYVTMVKFALFAISILAVARLWRRSR